VNRHGSHTGNVTLRAVEQPGAGIQASTEQRNFKIRGQGLRRPRGLYRFVATEWDERQAPFIVSQKPEHIME
jgi:hypothetical protein